MAKTPKSCALGTALRQAREERGVTMRAFAKQVGYDQAQLSRWETGLKAPAPEQVAQILTELGVKGEKFNATVELAYDVDKPSWVATSRTAQRHQLSSLIDYELNATKIVSISPMLVPALLQTTAYIRSIQEADKASSLDLATSLAIRVGRREVITRNQNPVRYVTVIGQSVLSHRIGSPEVMREQFAHLIEMARRRNIELHVLPNDRGWNPSYEGAFDFIETETAEVVFLEDRRSPLALHKNADLDAYRQAVDTVLELSLSKKDSIRFIADFAKRCEEEE